jgi:RNA polymerase sigma factor (sigma-70 family)
MPELSPAAVLLEHAEFLRRLATQLGGAQHGDDLAQDAWANALSRPAGVVVHEPTGWLRRVATNLWRNRHRAERRRLAHLAAQPARAAVPGAAEIAEREEVRRQVVAAVLALPQPLRDVVVLHFHEGLASPEIAARLGLSPSGVRTRMQQAMERLRHRLDAKHGGRRAAWTVPLLHWGHHASAPLPPAAAAFALATVLRVAAALLLASAVAAWLLLRETPVRPIAATAVAASPAAPPPVSEDAAEPPRTMAWLAAAAAAPSAAPTVYRGAVPDGVLRGVVRDADDGTAAAGARVRVRTRAAESSALAPLDVGAGVQRDVVADGAGEFVLALPSGAYELEATAADGRRCWRRVAVGDEDTHVELGLRQQQFGGSATVKVLDAAGRPVPAADVTLVLQCTRRGAVGWNGSPPLRGTTDATGTFRLDDVARLETVFEGLVLASTADGRAGTTVIYRPEHRGELCYWQVVVAAPGEIAATVAGAGDALAAAAVVAEPVGCYSHVWPGSPRFVLTRGDDGTFRAAVPAGEYHVRAEVPGKRRLFDGPFPVRELPTVRVDAGGTAATTVALADAIAVRGRVLDERGAPLPGATVRARWCASENAPLQHAARGAWHGSAPEDVEARADAGGAYELAVGPGRWQVIALADGMSTDVHAVVVDGEAPAPLEHRLVPDGAVFGVTRRATLMLRSEAAPSALHAVGVRGGAFALRGLFPGIWQAGTLERGTFVPLATFTIAAGQRTFVAVDRAALTTVRGSLQHDGLAVADVDVVCAETGARTTTAADGSFALRIPAAGASVRLEHLGVLLQRLDVPAGGDAHELGAVQLRARRVGVRALGPDDRPEAATLWAANWDDFGERPPRRFRADGRLDAQWMPPAGARCGVGARFADGSEVEVRLGAGERDVVLRRRPCGAVALRVVDPEGGPRPAATFRLLPWGRAVAAPADGASFAAARDTGVAPHFAVTDRDGRAVVRGVPPGAVLVYFAGEWGDHGYGADSARGAPPVEHVVEVRAGETVPVELVLPRR